MNAGLDIQFTLIHEGKEVIVNTFSDEFPDLRTLIMTKLNLDFFGECFGVGRCVTCVVLINSTGELKSNSEEFACQTLVDEKLNNAYINVIGDRLKRF